MCIWHRDNWRKHEQPTIGLCMTTGTGSSTDPCLLCMQVEEKTKLACQPEGYYGPLTDRELLVSTHTLYHGLPLPKGRCSYNQHIICSNLPATLNVSKRAASLSAQHDADASP